MKLKNKKGMTLTEVIAAIAIIGIMSAISIKSLTTARRDSELETAAEEVVAVLREAQNYSLTGKSISPTCNTYRVSITNGSSNYSLINSTCLNQLYNFKNGVVSNSTGNISFGAPHATVASSFFLVGGWYKFEVRKGALTYTICVNPAGLIKKLKGSVPCT